MTFQSLISKFYSSKYYANIMRRNWSHSFIFFIILFLFMPVAMLLNINNALSNTYWEYERKILDIAEITSSSFLILWVLLSVAFAVFSGISFMSFLSDRKKAYLFHSFPVKRSAHFVCHILACFSNFLISFILNVLITLFIILIKGVALEIVLRSFLGSVCIVLIYYILALSLTVLASVLTGQKSSAFALLLAFGFLPLGLYASFVLFITFHSKYINVEYYLSGEILKNLSAVVRAFFLAVNEFRYTALEGIITVLVSIGLLVAAYFIYKNRKVEGAGTPIIHRRFGEVLKYLVLFPLTFFIGWLFFMIGAKIYFWLYFGFVFGAFLVLIFFNLFLYRNSRKMFFGLKGFLIFLAVFLIAFGLCYLNTGDNIPSESRTTSIEVKIDRVGYIFKDEENIRLITEQAQKMLDEAEAGDYVSGYIDILFKNRFLIPNAKSIPTFSRVEYRNLMFTLLHSKEYLDAHEKKVSELLSNGNRSVYIYLSSFDYYKTKQHEIRVTQRELINAYLLDLRNPNRYDGQFIASVYLDGISFDLYTSDENVLDLTFEDSKGKTIADLVDEIKSSLKERSITVTVMDTKSGVGKEYTGEEASEICLSCVSFDSFNDYVDEHPNFSEEYQVHVILHEDVYEEGEEIDGIYYKQSYTTRFIRGKIPQFVISDFNETAIN